MLDGYPKSAISFRASRPRYKGRIAIVTDVGYGMRWTRQRRAREWSQGVFFRERFTTRKTNGADPPSLKLRRTGTKSAERLFRKAGADGKTVWS